MWKRGAPLLGLLALAACGSGGGDPAAQQVEEIDVDAGLSPDADLPTRRAACAFGQGARVEATLGVDGAARAALPIRNVVILMKENRSFDHLLGHLHDRGQPDAEAIPPEFTNPDARGARVAPFLQTTTCLQQDPDHQWTAMHDQIDHGKMDGFVRSAAASTGTDGHFAMSNYDAPDLPFYYWLASTYAIDDRHFASARTGTFPNRLFLLLGTPDGVTSTGVGYPSPHTRTIFQALDAAKVSWGVYSDGSPLGGALGWNKSHAGVRSFAAFLAALDGASLPQVSFVDGIDDVEDEHPLADVQRGEAWTRVVYEHATASALWPGIAIVWTYDEGGGFADHVAPPSSACEPRDVPDDEAFTELGARVPFAVISPWARPHHVSHVAEDHTAITRFVELLFDIPALTARDANSAALLDLFDFQSPPALLAPPPAPAAGTGRCSR